MSFVDWQRVLLVLKVFVLVVIFDMSMAVFPILDPTPEAEDSGASQSSQLGMNLIEDDTCI